MVPHLYLLFPGYGMTETTCASTSQGFSKPRKHGTVGFLLPNMQAMVRIWSQHGIDLDVGFLGLPNSNYLL